MPQRNVAEREKSQELTYTRFKAKAWKRKETKRLLGLYECKKYTSHAAKSTVKRTLTCSERHSKYLLTWETRSLCQSQFYGKYLLEPRQCNQKQKYVMTSCLFSFQKSIIRDPFVSIGPFCHEDTLNVTLWAQLSLIISSSLPRFCSQAKYNTKRSLRGDIQRTFLAPLSLDRVIWGSVHTAPEKFENTALFLRLGLPYSLIRHENRGFRKRAKNGRNLKTLAFRFRQPPGGTISCSGSPGHFVLLCCLSFFLFCFVLFCFFFASSSICFSLYVIEGRSLINK